MSEVRIPSSLKWLIVKRAKVHASLLKVERRLHEATISRADGATRLQAAMLESYRQATDEVESLDKLCATLREDLSGIDRTIGQHPVAVDADAIKPNGTYSPRITGFGQMSRLLRLYLYRSDGLPISTTELARRVALHTRLPADGELFETLRDRVSRRLRHMLEAKQAIRVHPTNGQEHGSWLPGPALTLDNRLAFDRRQDEFCNTDIPDVQGASG